MLASKGLRQQEVLRPAAISQTWEFDPEGLANTAWAYTTLAVKGSERQRRCGQMSVMLPWELDLQGLANIAWAMARTSVVKDSELLETARGISPEHNAVRLAMLCVLSLALLTFAC